MQIEIKSLTDQRILELTLDRVIMTHRDFNLKKSVTDDDSDAFTLHPEPKGVYDPRYFGSIFNNSCNCGKTRKVGVTCDLCGSQIMTDEMAYTRFARIDCGVYYALPLKYKELIKYLKNNYIIQLDYDKEYPILDGIIVNEDTGAVKYDLKSALMVGALSYSKSDKCMVLTNRVTDPLKSGLDSVVLALKDAGDDSWEKYLNRYLLVTPARMRPVNIMTMNGQKKIKLTEATTTYTALTYLVNDVAHLLTEYYGKSSKITKSDCCAMVLKKAALIRCIQVGEVHMTSLTASSKSNIARQSFSFRQANSGRAVITGDPELKIDEIGLPYHLVYEALKTDFIQHLRRELSVDKAVATERYLEADPQVRLLFKEYAESRMVLMNRAPTLHKYNVMCHKIRLIEDSTIHLSPMVCKSYNADFDGDTMSFFVVPEDIQDYVDSLMSPKYIKSFEKDDSLMFKAGHETINGITLMTKVVQPKGEPLTIDHIETARELIDDGDLDIYTLIRYKGRETTYGREIISGIIQAHLDHVVGKGVKVTSKNLNEVYAIINKYDPDTRTEMLKSLQKVALYWVTEYGLSTPTLKEVAGAEDHEFRPMVTKVLDDTSMDNLTKYTKAESLYKSRESALRKRCAELTEKIDESDRGKVSSLMEMTTPLFMVNDKGDIVIPEKPMIQGLSEREYVTHAYNNRSLLAIKSLATPAGGWLTRQLVFLCQSFVINSESDPDNFGITLPRWRCAGRTTTEGRVLGETFTKDTTPTRVRSVVQSRKGVVSMDMFSEKYQFTMEKNKVGISLASSLTEQLTQTMLGLKHGGAMTQIPQDYKIVAKERCKLVSESDDRYVLEVGGVNKTYPSSPYLRFMETTNKTYEAGSVIAQLVIPLPPTLTLEQIVRLIGARSMMQTNSMTKAEVILSDSYTLKGGKVVYDWENGFMKVGDDEPIELKPDVAYYYADGDVVPPRTKVTSGLMTPDRILKPGSSREDIENCYLIFRDQMYRILGSETKVNEELIELVFRGCLTDEGTYQKVDKAIENSASTLAAISYGYASKSITSAINEPEALTDDPMTNMLLNYMMKEAAHSKLMI